MTPLETEANPNIRVGPPRWGWPMSKMPRISRLKQKLDVIWFHRFKKRSHPKVFDWDWRGKPFNRIAAVNWLIANSGGLDSKYLEIGCASNDLFDSVASFNKTGVDPVAGGTHRMTSDDFFAQNEETFDVIFIDGLHEYGQVSRDAINALKAVKVGGYVAFHDFLPANWKEEHVPRISSAWTGDCWKLALQLLDSTGTKFVILHIDHGVGILKKMSEEALIPSVSESLQASDFSHFVSVVDKLPIQTFEDGINFFAET